MLSTNELRMHISRVLTLAANCAINKGTRLEFLSTPDGRCLNYTVQRLDDVMAMGFQDWMEEFRNYCLQWTDSEQEATDVINEVKYALQLLGFTKVVANTWSA